MRVLITNNTLGQRAGSELYVRDLATALIARGHTPIAYSTRLGEVAEELRLATVPVIDDLDTLATPPDIIHGQHHVETMTALLRFPGTPAIFLCHGWLPWEEAPPRFPRILRYVAVDNTCRDRLLFEHAIPEAKTRVLLNFVDLSRFRPRRPLPDSPKRALVFSNQVSEHSGLEPVREACHRLGMSLDVVGRAAGNPTAQPEKILGDYDIVFAKARAALEAMAVGAAVVLYDTSGAGPMVTTPDLERLRAVNFGLRALRAPNDAETLALEIARYDAHDAAEVSRRIRATADREQTVDELISLYREVIAEYRSRAADDPLDEERAAAAYLRRLGDRLKEREELLRQVDQLNVRVTELSSPVNAWYRRIKHLVLWPAWRLMQRSGSR